MKFTGSRVYWWIQDLRFMDFSEWMLLIIPAICLILNVFGLVVQSNWWLILLTVPTFVWVFPLGLRIQSYRPCINEKPGTKNEYFVFGMALSGICIILVALVGAIFGGLDTFSYAIRLSVMLLSVTTTFILAPSWERGRVNSKER